MTTPTDAAVSSGLLLAELSHRVANTFQIIGGLLARGAATSAHPEAAGVLLKADAQLRAFALLHEALRSGAKNGHAPAQICACEFVARLCQHLDEACLRTRLLTLSVQAGGTITLPEETCRVLGLIVTELVLNAVKHAFSAQDGGCIAVAMRRGSRLNEIVLSVEDDGVGMGVPKLAPERGLGFVDRLARSIGGALACRTGSVGTCITVTFLDADSRQSWSAKDQGRTTDMRQTVQGRQDHNPEADHE